MLLINGRCCGVGRALKESATFSGWLVMGNCLLMRRGIDHLSQNGLCLICNGEIEDIIHVLRDCPAVVYV